MQEDCMVQMGPVQEDALLCHQYYSVTEESAVITDRLNNLPRPPWMAWRHIADLLTARLWVISTNVNSLGRLKYGWQVKVQYGHLHRYIFEGVLIHRRTQLIRAVVQQSYHMQSLNCYAHVTHVLRMTMMMTENTSCQRLDLTVSQKLGPISKIWPEKI